MSGYYPQSQSTRAAKLYANRKALGTCVYCGRNPAQPNKVGCETCVKDHYEKRRKRLERSGKCDGCFKQAIKGRRYCFACNEAKNSRRKTRRQINQEKINAYKLEKGCIECGYNENPVALDFDHLPGFTKVRDIAAMARNFTWERILEEIDKCDVVCANHHHRIRTEERRKEHAKT